MKSFRIITKRYYLRKSLIYFLTFCLFFYTSLPVALAIDETNVVSSTGATFTQLGDHSIINTDNGAVINWNNFDTSSTQSVTFNQYIDGSLNSGSAVLNRVSGAATQFDGILNANGSVFIVNPAGVYFGATSSVNVNQLVASGLDISNADFLAGNYEFILSDDQAGGIANYGEINASEGVALIGRHVSNSGAITSGKGGFVVMAAGDRVLLGESGSSIVIEMDSVASDDDGKGNVINDGDIKAPSGTVVLAAGDIFSSALELPRVEFGIGTVEQNGTIDTDGTDGDGGAICLTAADEVILSNASETTANAGTGGDAGQIVVHSDGLATVQADALIEAVGGRIPDSDGVVDASVEIRGDQVNFAGDVDASATGGKRGKVLIDAFDITVADGAMPDSPPDNTIYEEWIEAQSNAATDVELVAHSKTQGNITVESIDDGEITGGNGDIVLRTQYATGGITFLPEVEGAPITTAIRTTKGGSIYMLAGAGGITTGDIITDVTSGGHSTQPGKIGLYTNNEGDINTGALTVNGGSYDEISVAASGALTIDGDVRAATKYSCCCVPENGKAQINLVSVNGDVDIDGTVKAVAYGSESSKADILISAGQDVIVNTGANQIEAYARTTQYNRSAEASVSIYAGGEFPRDAGGVATVHVFAKNGVYCTSSEVFSTDSPEDWDETNGDTHALLIIEEDSGDVPDWPKPPYIEPVFPELPVAWDDMTTTHMGQSAGGNVLENDDEGLTVFSYTQPGHGMVTVDENGNYIYTPDAGYADNGTPDTFTYIATDGELCSEPTTVTVTVTNGLPATEDDSASTNQGQSVNIDVLANDSDPDNDPLNVIDSDLPQHGVLVLNADGTFTYTPDPGYAGQDSFTYMASDGQIGAEFTWNTVVITINAAMVMSAAPIPEAKELGVSGCPALIQWTAQELGIEGDNIQIWMTNTLASLKDIQPCDACTSLKSAARVLQDTDGAHIAALTQVIDEFASSGAPVSEEQMALIADTIANNTEEGSVYALAGEYLEALETYITVVSNLGLSTEDAITFATDKYIAPLIEGDNVGLATYLTAKLTAVGQ